MVRMRSGACMPGKRIGEVEDCCCEPDLNVPWQHGRTGSLFDP